MDMEHVKEQILLVLGHAVSGAVVAAIYAISEALRQGQTDLDAIISGAVIGGSLGFLRVLADELERLSKPKATGAKSGMAKTRSVRRIRKYFGI